MNSPSPGHHSLDDLRDELSLNEAIYESLDQLEGSKAHRQEIHDKIESLRDQINKMQPPLPQWGTSTVHASSTSIPSSSQNSTGHPYSPEPPVAPPYSSSRPLYNMSLPSRKRQRNDFDEEFDTLNAPGVKAPRTPLSHTISPSRSVASIDSDPSDDPILRKLLGDDWLEEKRSNEQYLRELEARKIQEEEDAEFARQLAESWNNESVPAANPTSQTMAPIANKYSPNNYTQSHLKPGGLTFQKPVANRPEYENMVKPEQRYRTSATFLPESLTPSSDGSGLEEIQAFDWYDRYGTSQRQSYPFAAGFNNFQSNQNNQNGGSSWMPMPGTFSAVTNSYLSAPGASVYGNSPYGTSQYDSSTSSLGNPAKMSQPMGSYPFQNGSQAGSSTMPFDLDRYPLPPSLSYTDPEQMQAEIKDLLKYIRPDEELTPEQLAEIQPDGLEVNLMPHQRKGFAWMKSMEEGTNKGGILADDMGLGKTIQALALILGRPPAMGKNGRAPPKPTLIVAPVALMQQWKREIEKMIHKSHRLEVLILHGTNRNSSWNAIKGYDVVLTTYGLLSSDLKRKDLWDKHVKNVPDAKPKPQQNCPVLSDQSKFHRIILDEAQNIKNKNTRAALAACRVNAEYRWCLSGTPMQNNVDEIYSLIKFCRIRPYNDFEKFSKDIGRPLKSRSGQYGKENAMGKLQALLRAILLRRTKKSEIDGQPIIQLPEKHTVEDRAMFNSDELDFYKALETQAQIQFNRYVKNGSIGRNYSHALVLLLRLRQCCCSPQLITNAKDFLVSGALQDLDYVENARLLPKTVVNRLSTSDAFECPICMDAVDNPIIFNPCGHSLCQECLSTMVDKALADADNHKVQCPHCRGEVDTNKVTDHDSFLRVHFPDHPGVKPLKDKDDDHDNDDDDEQADLTDEDSSDEDDEEELEEESDDGFVVPDDQEIEFDDDASESDKNKSVKTEEIDDIHDDDDVEDKEDERTDVKKLKTSSSRSSLRIKEKEKEKEKEKVKQKIEKKKQKKAKGKKKSKSDIKTLAQLRKEGLRSRAAKKKYIRRLARGYEPSTKIEKTVELLREIKDRGEGEKTIIFSSFTSFLDLLEVALTREEGDFGIYTRYDGSMSAKDRNEAVNRFTDDPNCKAMLVSLKAGNAGLNLTAANHVIILDPFWNPFVEHQAADRCYRIGQLKEVTIHRVLIGEAGSDGNLLEVIPGSDRDFTVEDRILRLQERKRELVETALDETASGNIGRLGVRELGYLFGVNSMN